MSKTPHRALYQLLDICGLAKGTIQSSLAHASLDAQIEIYHQIIPKIEEKLWQQANISDLLSLFYELFQNLEALIAASGNDQRHHFIVVMPLADRPKHLMSCLDSLWRLCESFQYGGKQQQQYQKIKVLIADDSVQAANISEHKKIVQSFKQKGLLIEYFGLTEQQQQLDKLDVDLRNKLNSVFGQCSDHVEGHKGASLMRNISYLRLHELQQQQPNSLIYFIDSDQSFAINSATAGAENILQSINYFYYLDRIFSQNNVQVLTGKVVGDPPVSPSVMAAKFMGDVMAFLHQLKGFSAQQDCQFHRQVAMADDGAYHDMADLFGLSANDKAFDYHCDIAGEHQHVQSLNVFAEKLNHFFDGEHPTRKTYYQYDDVMASLQAARTVYTGNYILTADALKYFIPFAPLKLRMAGPSLGRILKAELAEKFVSANLPMLHQRTVESIGQSEFRAGIKRQNEIIDLSSEFERQFFGDVMLFSLDRLCQQSSLPLKLNSDDVMDVVESVQKDLLNKYQLKHQQLIKKMQQLQELINDKKVWWNTEKESVLAQENMQVFIKNMQYNFAENAPAYQLIHNAEHIQKRLSDIAEAVVAYQYDRKNWQNILQ